MVSTLLRYTVSRLTPYISGETIESVERQTGSTEVIKLSSNENLLGTSPAAMTAMVKALQNVHAYPDAHPTELYQRLALQYDLKADQILLGNGADNVLWVIAATFVNPGDEVVYCAPTFTTYRSATLLYGGTPIELPLTDGGRFDLESIQNHITARTKLVFICNPNNPTGTMVEPLALRRFVEGVPEHVILVLDEAYIEFLGKEEETSLEFVKQGRNVIGVRTFSKIYGLAGVRIGYAMARADLIKPMHTVREPFAANRIAIAGALAALEDTEFIERVRAQNRAGKSYLTRAVAELGMSVIPSYTNFLLVDTHRDAAVVCARMRERGILLRPGVPWGLPTSVRITIGTLAQLELVAAELREISNG